MLELAERASFHLSLTLGRLLRSSRYSTTRIVHHDGELQVRKQRTAAAPILVSMARPLMALLNTGLRILSQREWEQRERLIWRSVHGRSIEASGDGTLILPVLPGETLATLLERPGLDASLRIRAIELAVVALVEFHTRGFTHGDAMAENVMVDLEAGVAHWFDFETVHDADRTMPWRRADDVRALLTTCLLRCSVDDRAGILRRILDLYGNEEVTRALATSFTSALRRPLAFHLGQAGLSFRDFSAISRLLNPLPTPTPHPHSPLLTGGE